MFDKSGSSQLGAGASDAVEVLQECQRVVARAEAELNTAILGVAGVYPGTHHDDDWGREEVAAALRFSGMAAHERIELSALWRPL